MLKLKLQQALSGTLPGDEAHMEMMPYLRITATEAMQTKNPRMSAVMMLLFEEEDVLKTLLIHRSVYNGAHSGQIAFPGGKKEETDVDLEATALRETWEEIGILPGKIEVIGSLSPVYIPPSNFIAQPFVGWLDHKPEFITQEREVQLVIPAVVGDMFLPENRIKKQIHLPVYEVTIEAPCFIAEGHVVWGATALMLNEFRWIWEKISS